MNRAALAVAGFAILIGAGVWGAHEYTSRHPAASSVQSAGATQPGGVVTMASATTPAATQTETFQPYVLVNKPAPKPTHVTDIHRHLTLRPHDGQEYLADSSGRYYHVGRDSHGHIYPTYYDQVTEQNYPLYYDPARDNYYRVCRSGGHYYQCYVGDNSSQFYESDNDEDYSSYAPPPDDCPIITDPYTTFTYYSEPSYYYHPAEYRERWHDDNWLWAVPILIGAYFVLDQHSYPDYGYYYCYHRGPFIERDIVRENCYSAPVTFFNGGRRESFYASVRPPDEVMAPRDRWAGFENNYVRSHPRFNESNRPRIVTAPPTHRTAWYGAGHPRFQTATAAPHNGFAGRQGTPGQVQTAHTFAAHQHGQIQTAHTFAARQPGHNAAMAQNRNGASFRTAHGGRPIVTANRPAMRQAHRQTVASSNSQHFAARQAAHSHTAAIPANRRQIRQPQTAFRRMPAQHVNRAHGQTAFQPARRTHQPKAQTAFRQPRRISQPRPQTAFTQPRRTSDMQRNSGASSGFRPREFHMAQPRTQFQPRSNSGGGGGTPHFSRPSGGGGGMRSGGGGGGGHVSMHSGGGGGSKDKRH